MIQPPVWYARRSAVFAMVFAVGIAGGWIWSRVALGRYEPAFATVGASLGPHGRVIAESAALAIVVLALLLRIWGSSYLSASTVWDERAHSERIIIAGPFRFVRHPLYLGNVLLAIGLGAIAPMPGWIFIVVVFAVFIGALIAYEDKLLAAKHGEAFAYYRQAVPSILPRLSPAGAHQTVTPSLRQGVGAESFTLFIVAGMVGFFIVPAPYGPWVLAAAYVAGAVLQQLIERKAPR